MHPSKTDTPPCQGPESIADSGARCSPSLDTVPHLLESILATAIRSIARPILFAAAPHIATYLNAASHDFIPGPSHAAIFRMPWIDSTLATRLGDPWLLRQLANLATRSDRYHRPLQYSHPELARHAGASGNMAHVQFLVQETSLLEQSALGSVIQYASMHGHVHILEWFAADCPGAFDSLGPGAQFHVPSNTPGMGAEYLRVLQWWMDRQHLWVGPASDKSRHDWQVWVLVNACKAKRTDVVEYWLSVQDCKRIDSADPDRLREHLAWPLAAAAYTGDLEFFDQMCGLWPEAVDGTVLAFACGSGNLELAKYCHALLIASAIDAEQVHGIIIDKQAMDLCFLLATAAGGGQGDQAAIAMLNWLHTDLKFPMTGHYTVTVSESLWIGRILPASWPGDWGSCAPQHFVMDVATRLASTTLLDWWCVRAETGRSVQLTFFEKPLFAAVDIQHGDPARVLQWWIDSGLVLALHRLAPFEMLFLVGCAIEDGGRIEILDWLLGQMPERNAGSDEDEDKDTLFPTRIMEFACRAGRVDVLEWIVKNEAQLPAPVLYSMAFDDAYRYGHVKVLQWLMDRGYLDVLRANHAGQGGLSPEYSAISFMAEKWPECFECFEWSLANGFKMSKSTYKEVESKVGLGSGNILYSYLIQRKCPWGA